MFHKESIRLLRDDWNGEHGAKMLAEELYAMFQKTINLDHDGPVNITAQEGEGEPPLTINNFGDNDYSVKIIKNNNGDGFGIDNDGNIKKITVDSGGTPTTVSASPALFAKVVSGSGSTYSCLIYENGPGAAATGSGTVRIPNIDSGETIPAGTWLQVSRFGTTYWAQPAVWG